MKPQVDILTVIGLGMLLMPALTMWHEIGGHAAFCAGLGGHVRTIGAFYVDCDNVVGAAKILVACAGVMMNIGLALVAYACWVRAKGDLARLIFWLIWVSEAFVAAGYFCFSGVTGFGDLAPGSIDGLGPVPAPIVWRVVEVVIGGVAYALIVVKAIRSLATMIGTGPATKSARRTIAHGYYATAGMAAVLTGLLNPVGLLITIMSAAASSFGGLAGFISIGFANRDEAVATPFVIGRNWLLLGAGAGVLIAFALVLGPSQSF